MGEKRNGSSVLVGKPEGKYKSGRPKRKGRIIAKGILNTASRCGWLSSGELL